MSETYQGSSPGRSIAIIGSFRKARYENVRDIFRIFREAGFEINSPTGADITAGDQFVRFATDSTEMSDAEIQSRTLFRIFRADAVYVVAPNGYVGKTTCYEIGRVIQRRQPIYFSARPDDLPVYIPDSMIVAPSEFVLQFYGSAKFQWLFDIGDGELFDVERRLLAISNAP